MIAADGHAYHRFWIVLTPPIETPPVPKSGRRPLPETNDSVKAIRALEAQLAKETP
jgi:hypothetical protein